METPQVHSRSSFLSGTLLSFLADAQNADGGWGYRRGARSSAEPTCAALLANNLHFSSDCYPALHARGIEWLLQAQLSDGGWPSHWEERQGSWCTALALLALLQDSGNRQAVRRGFEWLIQAWPAEGSAWWRFRRWLLPGADTVQQDFSLRGWSWMPGTSSWVEPTSYAALALQAMPAELATPAARKRRQLAEALLLDRVCPGGGWNTGNPVVYGVAGQPTFGPTAWALMALRDHAAAARVTASLDWLERNQQQCQGPSSLALTHLALRAYGRFVADFETRLQEIFRRNEFLGDVLSFAWSAAALAELSPWQKNSESAQGS